MTRTLPTGLTAALDDKEVSLYYAVEFLYDTAPVRLWTGYGSKTINGDDYIGVGSLLGIDGLEEVADLSARAITISLSGIDPQIVSLALQEPYQNRECIVHLGINDEDPVQLFSGYMNVMSITDSGDTSSINLSVESKLVRLERSSNWRYTNENHKSRYPNDTFFSYVADLQDKQVVWGREKA